MSRGGGFVALIIILFFSGLLLEYFPDIGKFSAENSADIVTVDSPQPLKIQPLSTPVPAENLMVYPTKQPVKKSADTSGSTIELVVKYFDGCPVTKSRIDPTAAQLKAQFGELVFLHVNGGNGYHYNWPDTVECSVLLSGDLIIATHGDDMRDFE